MSSMSRRPRDPIAGAELMRVWKIICNFLNFLTSLKTLPILSVLRMVEVIPKDYPISANLTKQRITIVRTTTVKSKMFQESLKYEPLIA